MSGLAAIAEKAPIVSTFGVDALATSPVTVCASYDWNAATYVEQPPLANLRQNFIEAVRTRSTPKACLVAPFGYGKTSCAIGVWHACRRTGLLAVPPISCNSFTDIARAVRDWLRFMLPEREDEIVASHARFLGGSAEALARRDQQEFAIPFDQGLAAIRDKLERGYLDFEDVSIHLLGFFEEMTVLAEETGHGGLVVIVDEMQQVLGNAGKGVLVALRQLIWGLRTRRLPFGLLLTMDPETERTLTDRAGDILHRIKDDGFYLDIRRVYDRDFPARLWEQFRQVLDLAPEAAEAIDRATLEALGQLCERDDLSNGPRTVINALQRAAQRRQVGASSGYSPTDLIDDMVTGEVRFAGDRGLLAALLTELLNYPYFQRAPERARALKLLAAFPRGCPPEVADHYGLGAAYREFDDDLRGEIVTELDEGLALVGLQRVGRPANRLNQLLRRYWMQITDRALIAEDAPRVFAEFVIPLLFPHKLHDLNGWSGVDHVALTAAGDYAAVLEGTSSPAFPLRRVAVLVSNVRQPSAGRAVADDVDYSLTFRLDLTPEGHSSLIVDPAARTGEFTLALARPTAGSLGVGLAWIEHYLSPQPLSAAMVLSLLRYFAGEQATEVASRDLARIDDTLARLRQWLLAEMFPLELFNQAGYVVAQAGAGALQEFTYLLATRRWPEYQTCVVHRHWSDLLDDYERAIERIPPAARAGAVPVEGTKAAIADLFGLKRHASFESRARQYGQLLKVERWQGDDGEVRFVPLACELELARRVREAGSLEREDAYRILRSAGFAATEANRLLRMMVARGLATECEAIFRAPATPNNVELLDFARDLTKRCDMLHEQDPALSAETWAIVEAIRQGEDLLELSWRLDAIAHRVTDAEERALAEVQARREEARARLLSAKHVLTSLPSPTEAGSLDNHLKALHQIIENERRQLAMVAESILATDDTLLLTEGAAVVESLAAWSDRALLYRRWLALSQQATRFQHAILRLGSSGASLQALSTQLESVIHRARAVLAQHGLAGLATIGQLEVELGGVDEGFRQARDDRAQGYARVADSVADQLGNLFSLPTPVEFPNYNPDDDAASFDALRRTLAAATVKSLALLQLYVTDDQRSKSEKLARVKLRSDIRAAARRAADPTWLLTSPQIAIKRDALRTLRMLIQRVERCGALSGTMAAVSPQLARVLASHPDASIDLSEMFARTDGLLSRADVMEEVVRLVDAGVLLLRIELPQQPSESN